MNDVLNFLSINYKWILSLLVGVACLIATILKKRVKVFDTIKEFILDNLPTYIGIAEEMFSSGQEKKEFVVDRISSLVCSKFGLKGIEDFESFIDISIEKILSTPRKKGN